MAMLRRDRGRLFPLAVEAVMDKVVVGIDGTGIRAIAPRPACSGSSSLGGKEGGLGIGVTLTLSLGTGGFLGIAGGFFASLG